MTFERIAAGEPVRIRPTYDLTVPGLHNYYDAQGINHQSSGKNFTVEVVAGWTLHRLMLLESPHRYFGLAEGRDIDIACLSFVNHEQSQRIFFERLKSVVRLTKDPESGQDWFAQRRVDLRERGIGDLQETVIEFPRHVRARW